MTSAVARSQLVLRALVVLGPVAALLAAGPAGHWPAWWAVLPVLGLAAAAAVQPDAPFAAGSFLVVVGWWTLTVSSGLSAWVVAAGVALVVAHVAALLASYGPAAMPLDRATLLLWGRRGAVVALIVPATWAVARQLDGEPEQPGIWLLGVAVVFVAIVAASVGMHLHSDES